ncbi:hypothetical protein BESB_061640 [Besnoitia besnoiti]|uniref:Uncharacterized protein n=1 Tax=Besnoitia besnoiti TaxID=94643 RepID=A0A2A9MI58_BESBE|nr:hypothetical protein BESB_061640 [Besnoitia besnoiti]PFH35277.1 hypothetical protein BESB_061640 [Besnoitia besnoiti]
MLAAVGSRGQPQELSRSQYVGASSCRRDLSRAPTRARSRHVVPARRACGTLDISEDFDARMRSEELFAHPQIDMFRPSERRAPSTAPRKKSDMPKKPIVAPRFYDASSGVRKAKAEATEKETASSRRGTPLKYIGCPPAEPRLRPKKTSTGLEERLEKAGGYGVQIHWDEYAGYHVHATPPTVDLMHSDEVLLVRDSPEDEPTWEVSGCRGPRQPLGSAGERDRESSDAKKSGVPPCGRPRRCVPVYRFAPKLCEKSREIIDLYRQERLGDLWKKLDAAGEGVVDFFQLASQAQLRNPKSARRSANEAEEREEIRRGVLRPAGASEKAPEGAGGLSRIEERFVQACLPRLIQVAVSRSSKQILRDGQTLGPHFDASLRFTQAGPRGGLNPPVSVPTEPPIYPYPKPPDPMCVDLAPDAESEAAKLEKENAEAARASKRLARQHNQVVMLNVDQRLGVDASATPSLFVPRKKFEAVALDILAHEFGNSDIDLFRDRLMCECRKLVEKVNPEEAKKFFKPYILEYSRKLDAKRRKAREREREAERRGDWRVKATTGLGPRAAA